MHPSINNNLSINNSKLIPSLNERFEKLNFNNSNNPAISQTAKNAVETDSTPKNEKLNEFNSSDHPNLDNSFNSEICNKSILSNIIKLILSPNFLKFQYLLSRLFSCFPQWIFEI